MPGGGSGQNKKAAILMQDKRLYCIYYNTNYNTKKNHIKKGLTISCKSLILFGGAEQDRTVDLLTASEKK